MKAIVNLSIKTVTTMLIALTIGFSQGQSITGLIIPGGTSSNSGKNWKLNFYSSTNTGTNVSNYKEIQIIQNNTKGEYLVFDVVNGSSSNWEIVQGNPTGGSWFSLCKSVLENSNACNNSTCTTSYYVRHVGTDTGTIMASIYIGLNTATGGNKGSTCQYDTSSAFKVGVTVNKVTSTGIYNWTEPSSGTDSSYSNSSNWTPTRSSPSKTDVLVVDLATSNTIRNTTIYFDGVDDSISQFKISPYNNVTFKCSTSSNSGKLKIGLSTSSATGDDFFLDTLAGLRINGGTITTNVNYGNSSLFKSNLTIKSGSWIFNGSGKHVLNKNIVLDGGTMKFEPSTGSNTLFLQGKNSKISGSSGTLYIDSNMNVIIGNGATSTFTLETVLPIYSNLSLKSNTTLVSNSPTNYSTASNVNGFTPYLQLKSSNLPNSSAFGQILQIPSTSSISGGALFEIFNNNKRSFRTIGLPFSTDIILPQFTDDIDITGTYSGSNSNEFTTSCSTCNSSMFYWDEINTKWVAYTSGNTVDDISQGNGVLVFFRGAKGNGLGDTTKTASSQILDFKGSLAQGNVSISLSNSGSGTYKGYNLISNPYPCTIDLREVYESNKNTILPRFYMYDAISKSYNAWDSVGKNGNAPSRTGTGKFQNSNNRNKTKLLAPGAATFVIVDNSGTSTTLTFSETHKFESALSITNHFSTGVQEEDNIDCNSLSADLHFQDPNMPERDGFVLEFDQGGQTELADIGDLPKMYAYFGFGTLTSDGEWLAIDRRPKIAAQGETKVIPLQTVFPKIGSSELAIDFTLCENFDSPYDIYLTDKVANKTISIINGIEYQFEVTNEEDYRKDRFELVFYGKSHLGTADFKKPEIIVYPNPSSGTLSVSCLSRNINSIKIVNNIGQIVEQRNFPEKVSHINFSSLDLVHGVYQMIVDVGGIFYIEQLIIE